MYLYSLAPPAREPRAAEYDAVAQGAALFDAHCARCHSNAAYGGPPVDALEVGTDPRLAQGEARGTGRYRPAALLAVADAAPYFHDGSVPTLEDMFDPARLDADYRGNPHGPGPAPGHRFGMQLDDPQRGQLLAFLRSR